MSRIRVALVEDHDLTRVGLKTAFLRESGIEYVGEATNGTDGLKLLQTQRPDVGIVDIGLPGIDGIELTRRFKSLAVDKTATKILILTLQDQEEAVMAAFGAGADSYCMKDIKFDLLMEAIRATHQGNAWIDPAIAQIVLSQAKASTTPPSNDPPNYGLTERELEVLQLIVNGYSNADIAQDLYITVGTVKTHVRNILNKLCADDRTQAAVRALRSGLVC
ncbi:response regulator [Spirulina subsalsa]|uniref:response regulator n=1 Tax=Spirulina subsalsa TaxID=54311 RepID=UPI0002E26747|nr:response regulator transcription factor [Spirulina subsalsa]